LNSKRAIRALGYILVGVSLLFIGHKLWAQLNGVSSFLLSGRRLFQLLAGSAIYGISCFLLAHAWHLLLALFGGYGISSKTSLWIYARSHIARYIPGNVLHIAGRHLLGREVGLSHETLVLALLGEMGGLLAAATTLIIVALILLVRHDYPQRTELIAISGLGITVLAVGLFLAAWPWLARRYPRLSALGARTVRRGLAKVYAIYLVFFLIAGIVLFVLLLEETDVDLLLAATVLLAFSSAWLAGFITPGAPSGIGVREAVIVIVLQHFQPDVPAVATALTLRVATTLGDVLFLLGPATYRRFVQS
jgi:uncharacterized membrane protein YbhN (UPF0104 family)